MAGEVIDLNVGGQHFTTTWTTLGKYPRAYSKLMTIWKADTDGRYFIDCDGKIFSHILEFIRFETLPPVDISEVVHRYSEYFGLTELSNILAQFQPVKRGKRLKDIQKQHPEYIKLFNTVSDRLTRDAFHKSTPAIIVIKQKRNHEMKDDRPLISTGLKTELINKNTQLVDLEIISELHFETFEDMHVEKIIFLTANRLEELGFAQSVLYKRGSKFDEEVACFLLCNDVDLRTLHPEVGPEFRRQPIDIE